MSNNTYKLTICRYLRFKYVTFFIIVITCFSVLCALVLQSAVGASTGINEKFNFQGRLLDSTGGVVPDGNYNMRFKIYQDGDGVLGGGDETLKWTETRQNSASQGVTVKNGYFSVYLGSVNAFSTSVDWNQDTLWLSVDIGGTSTGGSPTYDGEMSPFKSLGASPFALNTKYLGGLSASQFVKLAQGVQTDTSTSSSLFINKTGASGNILQFQKGGTDTFVVNNSGAVSFQNTSDSTTGLAIYDADGGNPVFNVDTTNERVGIGTASPDNTLSVSGTSDIQGHIAIGSGSSVNGVATPVDSLFAATGHDSIAGVYETNTSIGSLSTAYDALVAQNILDPSGSASYAQANGLFGLVEIKSGNSQDISTSGGVNGFNGGVFHAGSGTISGGATGVNGVIYNSGGGTIETGSGFNALLIQTNGSIDTFKAVNISTPLVFGGTVTNNYGLYVNDQSATGSSNSYNIYSAGSSSKNYFEGSIIAGSGNEVLTLASGKIDADALTLVSALDGRSGTSSASGLATYSDGLSLLQGCSDGQVLQWVESTDTWDCATVSGGSGANTALSNLSSVAINTTLLPGGDNTIDLGSTSFSFRSLYADTSVLAPAIDVASSGALSIGNTTATSVSICNSAACDTISLGTNTDADTINIGDTNDTITAGGTLRAQGPVDESALSIDRIDLGVQAGTPRIVFENSGFTTWEVDNESGTFRWFTPGVVRMSLDSSGNLSLPTGSISATNFSGSSSGTNTGDQTSVSGNAGTATALQNARTINGTSFNGTANITITSAAGTLTGTTLNSTVTASSLTSVGTLAGLTVNSSSTSTITGPVNTSSGISGTAALKIDNAATSTANYISLAVAGTQRATLRASSLGNLILNGSSSGAVYLNFDAGTGGVVFGNGASGSVATVSSAGAATFSGLSVTSTSTLGGHTAIGSGATVDGYTSVTDAISGTTQHKGVLIATETLTSLSSSSTAYEALSGALVLNPSTAPSYAQISGFNGGVEIYSGNSQNFAGALQGVNGTVFHNGTGLAGTIVGIQAVTGSFGGGSITNNTNLNALTLNLSGTITNNVGLSIATPLNFGTITNNWGIYINDQSSVGSSISYNLYSAGSTAKNYFEGLVGIGSATSPDSVLQVSKTNSLFRVYESSTDNYDKARVAIGNSNPGLDQLHVNGRINTSYQMWWEDCLMTYGTTAQTASGALGGFTRSANARLNIPSSVTGTSGVCLMDFTGTLAASNTGYWGTGGVNLTERSLNPVLEARVQSNANTDQRHFVGFSDTAATAAISTDTNYSANEAFFRKTASGTQWESVTRSASGTEQVNTNLGTVNAYQTLRVELDDANAAARFYINGTLVATHTTVPASSTRLGYYIMNNITTTTNRSLFIDFFRVWSDDPPVSLLNSTDTSILNTVISPDGITETTDTVTENDINETSVTNDEDKPEINQISQSELNSLNERLTTLENQVNQLAQGLSNGGVVTGDTTFKDQVIFAANVNFEAAVTLNGNLTLSQSNKGINIDVSAEQTQLDIELQTDQPDDNYIVQCLPNWGSNCYVTDKSEDGFKLNFVTPPQVDSKLDWLITR